MYKRSSYGRRPPLAPAASAPTRVSNVPQIMDGLAPSPIQELRRHLIAKTEAKEHLQVEPREVTPISSYNWTNDSEPTILVPGCPPIWQNKPTPFRISRDSGVSFIDQNRHRVPQYPLLPLVLAVDHLAPEFDFPSVEIVTDRNNLRKLLRWVEGSIDRDFRIDLELAGSTVLFTRYESKRVEEQSEWLGFGRNFEQYTTKRLAGCENSTGHHRIISYNYGGLKLLVRFEVDACMHFDEATQQRKDRAGDMRPIPGDDPDDLLAALNKLTIRSDEKIEIVSRGVLVPQSSLIEMGTKNERSFMNGIDWNEYFPQLFFSQTPHHYMGVHVNGLFRQLDAHTLNDKMLSEQRRKQQAAFDKLRDLLEKIKELVTTHGEDERLSLVYRHESKKLELFSRQSKASALPDKWMNRFQVRKQNADGDKDKASTSLPETSSDPGTAQLAVHGESDSSDAEEKAANESDGDSD